MRGFCLIYTLRGEGLTKLSDACRGIPRDWFAQLMRIELAWSAEAAKAVKSPLTGVSRSMSCGWIEGCCP